MNSDTIKDYEVSPDNVWGASIFLDTYTQVDRAQRKGWRVIGGWGRDGYDLGSHPYVIFFFKDDPDKNVYSLAIYVEGDVNQYNASTLEERNAICDFHAHWYWTHDDREWVKGYPTVESLPDELRGPYREE
jgi:hypothetical protein